MKSLVLKEERFQSSKQPTLTLQDYGNNHHVDGITQFNKVEARDEACTTLNRVISGGICGTRFRTDTPACGDKKLDTGEECECLDGTTSCAGCEACVKTLECSVDTLSWLPAILLDDVNQLLPLPGKWFCCLDLCVYGLSKNKHTLIYNHTYISKP